MATHIYQFLLCGCLLIFHFLLLLPVLRVRYLRLFVFHGAEQRPGFGRDFLPAYAGIPDCGRPAVPADLGRKRNLGLHGRCRSAGYGSFRPVPVENEREIPLLIHIAAIIPVSLPAQSPHPAVPLSSPGIRAG